MNIENSPQEVAEYSRFPIGEVLYLQKKYSEALPHLLAGAKAAKVLPAFNSNYDQRIADCYDKLGEYEQAFLYQKQAAELLGELKQEEIASLKSESMIKYDSGRKDQELIEKERIIEQKNDVTVWSETLNVTKIAITMSARLRGTEEDLVAFYNYLSCRI